MKLTNETGFFKQKQRRLVLYLTSVLHNSFEALQREPPGLPNGEDDQLVMPLVHPEQKSRDRYRRNLDPAKIRLDVYPGPRTPSS